jgi:hypothetical protein
MQMSGFDNRGGWAGGLLTFSSVSRQAKPTGPCWFKEVGSHEEMNRELALLRSAPDGRPHWAISWVLGSEGAASRFPPLSHPNHAQKDITSTPTTRSESMRAVRFGSVSNPA